VGDAKDLLSLLIPPSPDPSPQGGRGILLPSAVDVEMEHLFGRAPYARKRAAKWTGLSMSQADDEADGARPKSYGFLKPLLLQQ
jgi:hypothetical protein